MLAVNSASTYDRAAFTDWIYFLPSNVMEEISPNTEALALECNPEFCHFIPATVYIEILGSKSSSSPL